jgi:hypothetical protein
MVAKILEFVMVFLNSENPGIMYEEKIRKI